MEGRGIGNREGVSRKGGERAKEHGDRGRRRRVGAGRSEVKVRRLRKEGAEGGREKRRRGRSRREAGAQARREQRGA